MIDNLDASNSLLRLLVSDGLRGWSSKALIDAVQDKSAIVRTAAARELHARPDVDAIFEQIIPLIASKSAYVREISAFVLGQLGTPAMPRRKDSYPYLIKLLSDDDEDVRTAAAAGIGHLSYEKMPKEAEAKLIALKSDKSRKVKAAVAYALGNSSGARGVLDALKSLSRDKHSASYARLGLDILQERQSKGHKTGAKAATRKKK
jgi:HEAT repeat protein